jgi:hypothetical protein
MRMMGMMMMIMARWKWNRRKWSKNRNNGTESYERDEDEEKGSFGTSLLCHRRWCGSTGVGLLQSECHSHSHREKYITINFFIFWVQLQFTNFNLFLYKKLFHLDSYVVFVEDKIVIYIFVPLSS